MAKRGKPRYEVRRGGKIESRHRTKALAQKAAGRLQAMSRGKLKPGTFYTQKIGGMKKGARRFTVPNTGKAMFATPEKYPRLYAWIQNADLESEE